MMWQLASFVSPYGSGSLKDRTRDHGAGLVTGSVLATMLTVLIIFLHARVMSRRRQPALIPVMDLINSGRRN